MTSKRLIRCVLFTILLVPATARAQDEVVYYHTDAIGSVRMLTGANGAVIERYDFLPFGERWAPPPNPDANTRQFAGKERDDETGLDYFGARYFRAQSARFTTVDPVMNIEAALADPQRWNRYSYALNNPLKFTDPDGRDPRLVGGLIGTLVFTAFNAYANVQQGQPWHQNIGIEASKGLLFGVSLGLLTPLVGPAAVGEIGVTAGGNAASTVFDRMLRSADPAIQFEGATGSYLAERNLLKAFNVNIGGRQIDAIAGASRQFVIEMTTGRGGGKLAQAAAQAKATGLDVIIYGHNLSQGFAKEAIRQGYRIARSQEELEKLLK